MVAASPPAPTGGSLARCSSPSPSIPIPLELIPDINTEPIPSSLCPVSNKIPVDPNMLHGGVERAANSGLGSEMGTDRVGRMGVQEDDHSGDPNIGTYVHSGRKRKQCKNRVAERKQGKVISKGRLPLDSKSASPRFQTPTQVVTSPGVKMLIRSAALRRASLKRAGSPETSHRSPNCTMTSPLAELPHVSPSLEDLSPNTKTTNSRASKRRRRKLISSIWREAMPIYRDTRLVEGRCVYCRQVFPASRVTGTSHIKRHLKVCEAKTAMNEMVDQLGCPGGIDPNWKFNPEVAIRKLVKLIVVNELPFSLVEYTPFREFTAALNPWFKNVSRTKIKNKCVTAFNQHSDEMKEYFQDCDSRISLTGDMWTSNQKLGYFCMTGHFISSEWVLHKRIIRFCMLETPHNALNMFNIVLNSIQEWNLEDKLFSFTLDNASVNTAMVNHLRENLNNKGFLLSEGKLLHFRCATHVFNIIVQDGLREIKIVINNIRESVKYVKSSQARVEKFLGIVVQEGLSSRYKRPYVDVTTRWNSTYLMLEAALPLRNAFSYLENQDKDYTFFPPLAEWKMAEAVCKLLEVFYTATVTLSGSKYPTSHRYFYQLWNIKKMLNKEESNMNRKILNKAASSQDTTIARMVKQMQIKFNQYWKETYKSACIPVVLDPRFKYDLLEYLLSEFGSEDEASIWMGEVKKSMQELFNEYSKEISVNSQRESDTQEEDDDDPLAAWDQYMRSKRSKSNNELDRYLKEDLTPRKEEVDILEWWKINSSKYPVLAKMARDVLAIPSSTVPSESAFSAGGRVVSDYRSNLTFSTVEVLICLQDWFKAADDLDAE